MLIRHSRIFQSQPSWPFSHFYDWLLEQMFQPAWEYRHGSVTMLRDLLKGQQTSSVSVCQSDAVVSALHRSLTISERLLLSLARRSERAPTSIGDP